MPSKLHFKEIDFVIYFPATGNENRDLKKYGVLTLRDLGPTSRIFPSSPCRIQFTVLYLPPPGQLSEPCKFILLPPKTILAPTPSQEVPTGLERAGFW